MECIMRNKNFVELYIHIFVDKQNLDCKNVKYFLAALLFKNRCVLFERKK